MPEVEFMEQLLRWQDIKQKRYQPFLDRKTGSVTYIHRWAKPPSEEQIVRMRGKYLNTLLRALKAGVN